MHTFPECKTLNVLLIGVCLYLSHTSVAAQLAESAEHEDWGTVKSLISDAAGLDETQPDGTTALHWAAWHDNLDAAKMLVIGGAKVDISNRYGVTPLELAAANGNAQIAELFIEAGANVNKKPNSGETILMTAARSGGDSLVRLLIAKGANVNDQDSSGQTAVMWAAAEGHAEVTKTLIQSGADFQTTLKSGFNALFFAVREGRQTVVDVLLDAGADINTAMSPKSKGPRVPRNGTSPLILAIENGHFDLAAHLLTKGADVNDQRSGYSPLHVISWVRKPNFGDDIDGEPPPIGSGRMTSLQLVNRLVENGADVNLRLKSGRSGRGRLNQKGATPFLLAADTADVPLMRLLLDLGADPTVPNADECPPILAAAGIGTMAPGEEAGTEEEAIAGVQLLLELGADINAVDLNGETVMHGAAYKNLPAMVRFLHRHGAKPSVWNKKNKYGWTPLLIAEGYRPGNFKPSAATVTALHAVMEESGLTRPLSTEPRPTKDNDQYAPSVQTTPKPEK